MTVITVSQLNNYVKRYIDSNDLLCNIWLKGEISNFKKHTSGHIYLTLKDGTASVKCVMFYSDAQSLKFMPDNGMKIIANGRISVYERDGVYQLYIKEIVPDGVGELYAAYEQLKNQLQSEGYFDAERKKPIPKYPEKIGIVTAIGGAALQDIINITGRRYPMAKIYVYPARVQGIGASNTIADGINYFNRRIIPDVIITGRGGGSIEDLWPFNERIVADSIFKSQVPVISAVGHETDYTIADFVADLRAPTPSAAAELAVPDCLRINQYLTDSISRCNNALFSLVKYKKSLLDSVISKDLCRLTTDNINDMCQHNDDLALNLNRVCLQLINELNADFSKKCAKLDALSPLKVLSRGYGVVLSENNVIKSVIDVNSGDVIDVILTDGSIKSRII